MALYLGAGEKVNLTIANIICHLIIPSFSTSTNGVLLRSFDNYILKDNNGAFLIAKEKNNYG